MTLSLLALVIACVALGLSVGALWLIFAMGREWIHEAGPVGRARRVEDEAAIRRFEDGGHVATDGLAPAMPAAGYRLPPDVGTTSASLPRVQPGDVDEFDEAAGDALNPPVRAPESKTIVHDPERPG